MKSVSVLVTGGNGQLGSELRALSSSHSDLVFTFVDILEMDMSNEDSILKYFNERKFDFIVNCAAYTAVDKAESERELCKAINANAVEILCKIAKQSQTRLIHISTDYVFSGSGNSPIKEDDHADPKSVYGETKLEGERHVLRMLPNAYVLRTAWVYSTFGKNFLKTVVHLAKERRELRMIKDQIGTPTYAHDLAMVIVKIILGVNAGIDKPGIYNYTNEGVASWYDFAFFIVHEMGLDCKVLPIATEEYPTAAQRPRYSLLDKKKIANELDLAIPHWTESARKCIKALLSE